MARCAWCGRVNVGAEYLKHDETAELLRWWPQDRVTHSICSDCFDEQERRRLG
jgi:hypothetical protein